MELTTDAILTLKTSLFITPLVPDLRRRGGAHLHIQRKPLPAQAWGALCARVAP